MKIATFMKSTSDKKIAFVLQRNSHLQLLGLFFSLHCGLVGVDLKKKQTTTTTEKQVSHKKQETSTTTIIIASRNKDDYDNDNDNSNC